MSPWTDNQCQQQQKCEEGWQSVWLQYTVWNAKHKKNENIFYVSLMSFFHLSFIFKLVYIILLSSIAASE